MNTDPADWLRAAVARWLSGDGELTAMGLSGADRLAARRWLRNRHIRAAFNLIPGDRFSDRLTALVSACERLNRVRQGYRHQRQDGALFDALERAAYWAELPAERQLRTIVQDETADGFSLQEAADNIVLKLFNEDDFNEQLSAGTD